MAASKSSAADYHKRYAKRYASTPRGAAVRAWAALNQRARSRGPGLEAYSHVEVRMTRDEFLAWAIPEYESWFARHPGVTPSVDRVVASGHYEVSNLQILSVGANRYKNSRHRNLFAPPDTHWCCRCQGYVTDSDFDTAPAWVTVNNPRGLCDYCKPCRRARMRDRRARQRHS